MSGRPGEGDQISRRGREGPRVRPRRLPARLALALTFAALGGCATLETWQAARRSSTSVCQANPGGVLTVRGPTDARMLDCFRRAPGGPPRVIEIDSLGGNVEPAMDIADLLAPARPHIIVDGSCSSSCANYLLPMAGRITLRPGARILLHGSADGALLASSRAKFGDRPAFPRIYARQARWAATHAVALGWLLYRDEDEADGWGRYVRGHAEEGDGPARYLLVEEAFLRSCLGAVPVEDHQGSDAARARGDAAYRARLARRGIRLTGEMRCVEGAGA